MRAGFIGLGGRSLAYLPLIQQKAGASLCAICDIDAVRLKEFQASWLHGMEEVAVYTDYRLLLRDERVDTVFILTPDTTHRMILEASISAGKHILLEKPMATTMEDALAIRRVGLASNNTLALGFVLRYTPVYTTVKAVLSQGRIGRLVSLRSQEMLDTRHAASFYRRWHRFSINNGGLMNAKCCHDLDLLNWLTDSSPSQVNAFGGKSVFLPNEAYPQRCSECSRIAECLYAFNADYYEENFRGNHSLSDLCVYNAQKDIVDHESMQILFDNGVVAQFDLCMVGYEENRRMELYGTQAALLVDFNKAVLTLHPLNSHLTCHQPEVIKCDGISEGHGGGDHAIIDALYDSVHGVKPINHTEAGFFATCLALAGEESMKQGRTVNIREFISAHQ